MSTVLDMRVWLVEIRKVYESKISRLAVEDNSKDRNIYKEKDNQAYRVLSRCLDTPPLISVENEDPDYSSQEYLDQRFFP